jgi:hypothetical protein
MPRPSVGAMDDQTPEPLDDDELTRKDTSYSPSSERETEERQRDEGDVLLPGTGGPDDSGDLTLADGDMDLSDIDLGDDQLGVPAEPPADMHAPDRTD